MFFWGLALGFLIGFAVTWWGTWYRLSKIEGDLRWIANAANEQIEFGEDEVPAEWVADQIDWLRQRNFP